MTHPAAGTAPKVRTLPEYERRFVTDPGYLDFARSGPPSIDAVQATARALQAAAQGDEPAMRDLRGATQQALETVAAHLAMPADQVCLSPSTSAALFQVAYALPPAGDVLVSRQEFPANVYPWARAAERGGPAVRFLSGPMTPETLSDVLDDSIAAVAVSAVDFRTGFRVHLEQLRDVIGDRLLLVDGIQAFGAVVEDWSTADALAVGGQKWLRAGWGTGFLALSARALDRLDAAGLTGYSGVASPDHYDSQVHPPTTNAARFSMTNPSPGAAAGLTAGLGLVEAVGITAIAAAIADRADALVDDLVGSGAELLTPTFARERAGIVSFTLPGVPPALVDEALRAYGITATLRQDHIRLAVHASTPPDTLRAVGEAVASVTSAALRDPAAAAARPRHEGTS